MLFLPFLSLFLTGFSAVGLYGVSVQVAFGGLKKNFQTTCTKYNSHLIPRGSRGGHARVNCRLTHVSAQDVPSMRAVEPGGFV